MFQRGLRLIDEYGTTPMALNFGNGRYCHSLFSGMDTGSGSEIARDLHEKTRTQGGISGGRSGYALSARDQGDP
ncbi:hypothetical protein WCLP8_2630018 [uncultured Gammaproteobacteria bacterium]